MKIGIDIDETLADTVRIFLEYYNTTYGTSVKRDQVLDYYFNSVFTWTKEENLQHFEDFYASPFLPRYLQCLVLSMR